MEFTKYKEQGFQKLKLPIFTNAGSFKLQTLSKMGLTFGGLGAHIHPKLNTPMHKRLSFCNRHMLVVSLCIALLTVLAVVCYCVVLYMYFAVGDCHFLKGNVD